MPPVRSILKEPLLHFLALGAALFLVFAWRSSGSREAFDRDTIVVTRGKVENLAALFAKTRQRPPTADELDGLVRDYVREEVLYREGLAMGLDRDDTVIRRRIRQKFEFIIDDMASQREPTDEELAAYLADHAGAFAVPPRYTFQQVYLHPERREGDLEAEAARWLAQLNAGEVDPAQAGDRSLLENAFRDLDPDRVAGQFGGGFARALPGLPVGRWAGPVPSGLGFHLVRVDRVEPGRTPGLDEVRDEVAREWAHARRLETREQFFGELESRYAVTVESGEAP